MQASPAAVGRPRPAVVSVSRATEWVAGCCGVAVGPGLRFFARIDANNKRKHRDGSRCPRKYPLFNDLQAGNERRSDPHAFGCYLRGAGGAPVFHAETRRPRRLSSASPRLRVKRLLFLLLNLVRITEEASQRSRCALASNSFFNGLQADDERRSDPTASSFETERR